MTTPSDNLPNPDQPSGNFDGHGTQDSLTDCLQGYVNRLDASASEIAIPDFDCWSGISKELNSSIDSTQPSPVGRSIPLFSPEFLNAYHDHEYTTEERFELQAFEAQLPHDSSSQAYLADLNVLSHCLQNYRHRVESRINDTHVCPESIAHEVMSRFQAEQRHPIAILKRGFTPKRFAYGGVSVAAAVLMIAFFPPAQSLVASFLPPVEPVQEEILLASSLGNRSVPSAEEYFIRYCNLTSSAEESTDILYGCINDSY